nr:capsid protein [Picobirnavirus sp.]
MAKNYRNRSSRSRKPSTQQESTGAAGQQMSSNGVELFYTTKDQLLNVASFPFATPVGPKYSIETGLIDVSKTTGTNFDLTTPGIVILDYVPTIPDSASWTQQVTRFETGIRSKNSRTAPYTGNDLMMAQLALTSAYSMYFYLTRTLGLLKNYSTENNYVPRALVTTLGYDVDDLIKNQANYRSRINQLAIDLNSLPLVEGMSFLPRWKELNSKLFADSETYKSQFYMFRPTEYWEWSATGSTFGSSLVAHSIVGVSFSDLIDALSASVNLMREDSDIKYMISDIDKAYPDSAYIKLEAISEDFYCAPEIDWNMLESIMNATVYPIASTAITPISVEAEALLTAMPAFDTWPVIELGNDEQITRNTEPTFMVPYNGFVFTERNDLGADESANVVVANTRFMAHVTFTVTSSGSGQNTDCTINTCGSEIITAAYYYEAAPVTAATLPARFVQKGLNVICDMAARKADDLVPTDQKTAWFASGNKLDAGTTAADVEPANARFILQMDAYDAHPKMGVMGVQNESYTLVDSMVNYPRDNFTHLTRANLTTLNREVAYRMLDILVSSGSTRE